MSGVNIRRAVENIRSGTTVYTPVIELIVNAIQAIRLSKAKGGLIDVTILRSRQTDLEDGIGEVDGFIVADDGIGFNEEHRNSFDTIYSALKAKDGGKGFGRFTCLKYFENLSVQSVFVEAGRCRARSFNMGTATDIIVNEDVSDTDATTTGSQVRIDGIKRTRFPDKGIDTISRVLVEKLLPYFIDPGSECPRIVMRDSRGGEPLVLNDYLSRDNRQIVELGSDLPDVVFPTVDGSESFAVRVFKFYAPRTKQSKISLVAHRREVTEVPIHTYIPEFAEEFFDKAGSDEARDRNFVIKAYVFGPYLDDNVSLERGGFLFHKEADLIHGISQAQIEAEAALIAQDAVGLEIAVRRERKQSIIRSYVDHEAPWHRELSVSADFSSLPMRPKPQEIEAFLQGEKFRREVAAREGVASVLADPSRENLHERVAELVDTISQTSKNDLIHYVSMRKCVLDLFGASLETDEEGNYVSEADVHRIIMPQYKDTDQINFEEHNLWILDERLNFAGYVASDRQTSGRGTSRSDITAFDRRIAFRGDNVPSNPITIFEFKKPGRHNFADPSSSEDPVQQIIRYVNEIRDGKYKTPKGREIHVTDNTPFYGYVVCDFSAKIRRWLEREKDFTPMPDNLGYFKWLSGTKLYIEVLSWTKLHHSAEMRNKIFFHKLGMPTGSA